MLDREFQPQTLRHQLWRGEMRSSGTLRLFSEMGSSRAGDDITELRMKQGGNGCLVETNSYLTFIKLYSHCSAFWNTIFSSCGQVQEGPCICCS